MANGAPALPSLGRDWGPRMAAPAVAVATVGIATLVGFGAVSVPVVALALPLVLAFAVVAIRDLAAGVTLLTVVIFFDQIPGIPTSGITLVKLAGILVAVSWAGRMLTRRTALPFLLDEHPLLAFLVVGFAAWAGASMLWAEDVGQARATSVRLAQGGLLLFIVFSALCERRHFFWVLRAFVFAAVVSALIGLAGATAAEDVGPGSETIRLAGGIGDPNELAAILVPAVTIAIGLAAVAASPLSRLALAAGTTILVLALFWTQSRGGLVAMAATLVIAPFLAGRARQRVLAVILSIGALAVIYFSLLAPPQQLERVTSFESGGGTGRTDLWAIAIEMSRDRPLLGVGAGNFVIVEPRYATRDIDLQRVDLIVDRPKGAHNTYLHELTELGLIGLVLLVLVFVACFRIGYQGIRALERAGMDDFGALGRAVAIGVVGMLAAFTFISAAHREQLWLLLGVLVAFGNVARRAAKPD